MCLQKNILTMIQRFICLPLLLFLICFSSESTFAQTKQLKHVLSSGGDISNSSAYISFSVIGQLAASEFSTGNYSGTIGYLDISDNDPNSVLLTDKNNALFRVLPNPSMSDVFLDFKTDDNDEFMVVILNTIGTKVYEQSYQRNINNRYLLKANIFPVSGNYTVNIYHRNNNYSQKLSIIK